MTQEDLTHVDDAGAARMVDVSEKPTSARTAVASGVVRTTSEVIALLRRDGLPKGDALATARIAGVMAAKRTSDLVPLCHPIALSSVEVDLDAGRAEALEPGVRITATVRTADRTGVEMEALTAVTGAGLALHDMIKAVDPAAVLDAVRVERKDGGKTGTWTRDDDSLPSTMAPDGSPDVAGSAGTAAGGEAGGSSASGGSSGATARPETGSGHESPESSGEGS